MTRAVFILNIASPYRVDFINELNKYLEVDVVFEKSKTKSRRSEWLNHNIENQFMFINNSFINILKLIMSLKKYDIVVIGGYSTKLSIFLIILFKLLRKKFILNADGGFIKSESKTKYYIKKFFISSASYWLSTGPYTTKYLLHYGAKSNRIFEYPFSSIKKDEIKSLSKESKNRLKKKMNIPYNTVILYVGRFIESKGIQNVLNSSLANENIGYYYVGGEPTEEYLNLSKGKKNIHFINHLSKDELDQYYLMADLFLFPTLDDVWGLVVNEAFSKGIPVITTDKCIAGIEMISSEKLGIVIDVKSSGEVYHDIINDFVNEKTIFNKDAIINKASYYTIENMAFYHYEAFKKFLEMI